MERRDILKKVKNLEEEISSQLFTYDKEEIEIGNTKVLDKITEISGLVQALHFLNLDIDEANQKIKSILRDMQKFDKLISMYKGIRKQLLDKDSIMGFRETPQKYSVIEIEEINKEIENAEIIRRKLDKEIQKYNWGKELDINM